MPEITPVPFEKPLDTKEWHETMLIQAAFLDYVNKKSDRMSPEEVEAFGKWFRDEWDNETDAKFREQCQRIFDGKDEERKQNLMRMFYQELKLIRKKAEEAHRRNLLTH